MFFQSKKQVMVGRYVKKNWQEVSGQYVLRINRWRHNRFFCFQVVNISQVINYILFTGFEVNSGTNCPRFFELPERSEVNLNKPRTTCPEI